MCKIFSQGGAPQGWNKNIWWIAVQTPIVHLSSIQLLSNLLFPHAELHSISKRDNYKSQTGLDLNFTSKVKTSISRWYEILSVSGLDVALFDSKLQGQREKLSVSHITYMEQWNKNKETVIYTPIWKGEEWETHRCHQALQILNSPWTCVIWERGVCLD